MGIYLLSISLFTYALVTFFLLIGDSLPPAIFFKHFWPSLLLVVSRGLIMLLLMAFLSGSTAIINGLDVLATLCFVWLLLSFIPNLSPKWWIAARWGGGFALVLAFLAFILPHDTPTYVYGNLIIPDTSW